MDYEKFIKSFKKSDPEPSVEVWSRLEKDLFQQPKLIFPVFRLTLATAAVAVMVLFSISFYQQSVMKSYMQFFGTTEYIYEECRYPS